MLAGEVVVITGVGPGLGAKVALRAAAEGAKVVMAARSTEVHDVGAARGHHDLRPLGRGAQGNFGTEAGADPGDDDDFAGQHRPPPGRTGSTWERNARRPLNNPRRRERRSG